MNIPVQVHEPIKAGLPKLGRYCKFLCFNGTFIKKNSKSELRSDNCTPILKGHAVQTLRDTCNDVAWLHMNKHVQRGEPNEVIDVDQEF